MNGKIARPKRYSKLCYSILDKRYRML